MKRFTYYPNFSGATTKVLIFALDTAFAILSFLLALLVLYSFDLEPSWRSFISFLPYVVLMRILGFSAFKTYSIIIRYTGEKDYRTTFFAVTVSSLALFALYLLLLPPVSLSRAVATLIVDYVLLLAATIGMRILLRLVYDYLKQHRVSRINTAIFGAGELGSLIERVLRHDMNHNYRVVAFLDDNPKVHRKQLNGIPIYMPSRSYEQIITRYNIKVVIIAIQELPEARKIEFLNACLAHKVKVLKTPPTSSWINGNINVGQLKDINLEDLLNRPPIRLDEKAISRSVTGKVVLVTGCAGSIGSEIVRQLLKYRPARIIGLDQAESPLAFISLFLKSEVEAGTFMPVIGDVRDRLKMRALFEQFRPDYIFHAAAYKHVPVMETYPEEAIKVNVQGTRTLADLAAEFRISKFVMVSTDKVVNPGNVMGASKRIAEMYVQALNYAPHNETQFTTTRFGNVLGSNGSVIPIFKEQIERMQPVTVTDPEVTRFFMTIPEACQLVLEAGAMGKGGEIFIFDMGEPVRIVDLATKMIQLAGLTPGKEIDIVFTGMRPGEKLAEELLSDQEGLIPTHHAKIMKASVRACDFEEIKTGVDRLTEAAVQGHPAEKLVAMMKALVPEFTSRNSVYACLDELPVDIGAGLHTEEPAGEPAG